MFSFLVLYSVLLCTVLLRCVVLWCGVLCFVFFNIGFDDGLDKEIARNDENNIEKTTLRILITSPLNWRIKKKSCRVIFVEEFGTVLDSVHDPLQSQLSLSLQPSASSPLDIQTRLRNQRESESLIID